MTALFWLNNLFTSEYEIFLQFQNTKQNILPAVPTIEIQTIFQKSQNVSKLVLYGSLLSLAVQYLKYYPVDSNCIFHVCSFIWKASVLLIFQENNYFISLHFSSKKKLIRNNCCSFWNATVVRRPWVDSTMSSPINNNKKTRNIYMLDVSKCD
jgi:hypothetical protein